MTDRVSAFTVLLDRDYREDDVEAIHDAILMVKGVLRVETIPVDSISVELAKQRLAWELLPKIRDAIQEMN